MEERSLAAGPCPNCGLDWTAHSDYIARSEKVCVEALLNGYFLHIHYTDQDTLSHAQVYKGDLLLRAHDGEKAIALCKNYIERHLRLTDEKAAQERDADEIENDPVLLELSRRLKETAPKGAIDPAFRKRLLAELMQQMKEPTLEELLELKRKMVPPIFVTHSGSTSKCKKRFQEARLADTIAGKMVLTVGCDTKSDHDLAEMGETIDKTALDVLHLWKIWHSQEVLILDVTDDGQFYLGSSTRHERDYAEQLHKRIRYWSHEHGFGGPTL